MCRAKSETGRRCTSSTPEYRRTKRAEAKQRRLAEAAVTGTHSAPVGAAVPAPRTLTVTAPNGETVTLEVPAGHLHHSEVLARGWTKELALAHLTDHAVRLEGTGTQTSPKCYPVEVVEALEVEYADALTAGQAATAAAEAEKAVKVAAMEAAEAARMPRQPWDHYNSENTIGRGLLKARGWTDGHIDRLLGQPDYTLPGTYSPQYLWGRERVEMAEATDEKLRKRIAQYQQKAATEKAERIEKSIESGHAVFRKDGDRWVLQGRGLKTGDTVTVTKRDGTTVQKRVARVVSTDASGLVTAVPVDERAEQWARERAERAEQRVQEKAAREAQWARERAERAAESERVQREARPTGNPPLPQGVRRNQRDENCHVCSTHVPAGEGHLALVDRMPDDYHRASDGDFKWAVRCPSDTWRRTYAMRPGTDPMPWVELGWTADQVRLAHRAGLTPAEARKQDPTDPEVLTVWETMAALTGK